VVAVLFGILVVGFFRVQVLRSDSWVLRSDNNRLRVEAVPAPRGAIFDRNGEILADDVPGYRISFAPQEFQKTADALTRIREYLPISDRKMAELMRDAEANPLGVLVLHEDAPRDAAFALEERRNEFPALHVDMRPRRRYPYGPAIAHSLGYMAQIDSLELKLPENEDYRQGMLVGRSGIEKQYELLLRGEEGARSVEVDALGRIVGTIEGVVNEPASAGGDIRTTLDGPLQEFIHSLFPDTLAGAVVAIDPSDGGVLALYSGPSYDPNDWVGGINTETYGALTSNPLLPLLDRTVNGRYAPASTWKLVTATIGLELGLVTPEETMPVPCTGSISLLGRTAVKCWRPQGHGEVDLEEAVKHSCDVYFYQLGARIGLERYVSEVNRMGLADRCGLDFPQELPGLFPPDLDYYIEKEGVARENEILNLSIGQGDNAATPLKIAQLYVALARDGTAPAPWLVEGGATETPPLDLGLSPENLAVLRRGLLRTVTEDGGTAHLSMLEHWELIGKTGTAQSTGNPDHAWFAGAAGRPGGEPEIVIVVFVEFGLHGSDFAGLAAKAADFYLRRKYGMPVDSVQTLREHYDARVSAPWGTRAAGGG
jgi:penicillin-binding protein 2